MLMRSGHSRFLISSPESALRLGRVTGLMELRLPTGFHALPVEEQDAAVEEAASAAVEHALDALRHQRTRAG